MILLKAILQWIKAIPTIIQIYLVIALLAPILANEKPILIKYNDQYFFPALSTNNYFIVQNSKGEKNSELVDFIHWNKLNPQFVIYAPIRWSPGKSDLLNANFISPLAHQYFENIDGTIQELPTMRRHFLGTTRTGEDVLSGLIYGTRIALTIGISFVLIAGIIGLIIGGLAGFFGDFKLKMSYFSIISVAILFFPAVYLSKQIVNYDYEQPILKIFLSILSFIALMLTPIIIELKIKKIKLKKIFIPIDFVLMRFVELFLSLPRLILIVTIAAMTKPSLWMLVLIIGLTSWTDIARITRAEVMKLREVEFIQVGRSIGLSFNRLMIYHFLPNIFSSLQALFVYGFASAILTETGLSFLGIGLPAGITSWGTLMFAARENFTAWWLVIFPGLSIALLLVGLNSYAGKLGQRKNKSNQSLNIF